jgi:hypothetical protein
MTAIKNTWNRQEKANDNSERIAFNKKKQIFFCGQLKTKLTWRKIFPLSTNQLAS